MIIEGERLTDNDTNVSHLTDPNFQDLKYDEEDVKFYQLLVKRREKRKEEARQRQLLYEQTPNTDTDDSVEDIDSDGLTIGDGLFDFEQEDSFLGKDTTYDASNSHNKISDNKDDHQVEEDTYQVDKIIAGPKKVNGVMSVRVSWLPSGKKVWDPTWEPLDNIKNDVPIEWSKYLDSRKEKELNKKKKEEVKINKECKHCRMPVVQDEVACHKCKHIIHSQCGFNDGGTITCCNCLDTSSLTKFRQTYVCPSAHNLSQYDPRSTNRGLAGFGSNLF